MGRPIRKVMAIKESSMEKRIYDTVYLCAKDLGTNSANVLQALNRNGICCGWRLYDHPETLRKRIEKLQMDLQYVESII